MVRRLGKKFLLGLVGALVIALAISLFTAATASTTLSYAVTDLGVLPGKTSSVAYAINDAGWVVGASDNPVGASSSSRAFLWRNKTMIDLSLGQGYGYSKATDINNAGQVVGQGSKSGKYHAFLWQNDKMTTLGFTTALFDQFNSGAYYINNRGVVVGYPPITNTPINDPLNFPRQAFLWKNGKIVPLSVPPPDFNSNNPSSFASGINNKGQIVGSAMGGYISPNKTIIAKYLLWNNRTPTDLGIPNTANPGAPGYPTAINYKGQVVGNTNVSGSSQSTIPMGVAFLWQNNNITYLGSLKGGTSTAYSINASGKVVGRSDGHAFVWQNGVMSDLNNLLLPSSGWELISANDINNKGQIVGLGIFNHQQRAFLLTPTQVSH